MRVEDALARRHAHSSEMVVPRKLAWVVCGWRKRAKSFARKFAHRSDHLLLEHEEPALGAHLVTPRMVGYIHHGIYAGSGRVMHSGGFSSLLPGGPVEEVSLAQFGRGWPVLIRHEAQPRFAPQEIVERARSRLGEDRYGFFSNNCEHFCEWCLTDEPRSHQVDRLMRLLNCWKRPKTRNGRHATAWPAAVDRVKL